MKFWENSWANLFVRFARQRAIDRKVLESKLEHATMAVEHHQRMVDRLYEQNQKLRSENRVLRGWSGKRLVDETEQFLRPE